jgi:hypothetical protein
MRQSSNLLEERVLELETRVDVLESLLAERYPPAPASAAVEPSSKKKAQQKQVQFFEEPRSKRIYLKNPDEPNNTINGRFGIRIVDFDKVNSYTSNPKNAEAALYFMMVHGSPNLAEVNSVIEKDGFSKRVMIFLHLGTQPDFSSVTNLLPGTPFFFFPLFNDWGLNYFEEKGTPRRYEQDVVLEKAISYLTK